MKALFLILTVCLVNILASQPCTADFTYTSNNNTVSFINQSVNGHSYTWDFGDGNLSGQLNPVHTYASSGSYGVTLTVFDSLANCSFYDTVYVNFCNIFFWHQDVGNGTINFNSNYFASNRVDYVWDFGDGSPNIFNVKAPSHTYSLPGTYTVSINLYDSASNTNCSFVDSVNVSFQINCSSSFSYIQRNDSIQIINGANNYDSLIYQFGDGSTSSMENPMHIYAQNGTYQICQTVFNSITNCVDSSCSSVQITKPPNCLAGFNHQTSIDTLFITNTAQNFNQVSYDFGDGFSSNIANPIHIYTQSGNYTVCQTILDTLNNCVDSICKIINVAVPPQCQAGFIYTSVADTFYFTNSAISFERIEYEFGDGAISTNVNPTHTYAVSGQYIVTQRVYNDSRVCSDTIRDTLQVNVSSSCFASFVPAIDTTNTNLLYLINNSSKLTTHSYLWDFGDGNTSSNRNPTHNYTSNIAHQICLTISDSTLGGCISIYCDTIGLDSNGNILKSNGYLLQVIDGSFIGLEEINRLKSIEVYPNPFSNKIYVSQLQADKIEYQVYNNQGRLIITDLLFNNWIDLSMLKTGIYFLHLRTENGAVTKKIIKQ